ncbi:MAG: metallophosphoesterase [Pseudomonadota bacterium]
MARTVRYGTAQLPEGLRLYVIGDVHGELDALRRLHDWIGSDLSNRPPADWRIVHLGDLIDRGPDSAGVLAFLAGCDRSHVLSVCGNHDAYLKMFLADPMGAPFSNWLYNGGDKALQSFGVDRGLIGGRDRMALHEALQEAMPVTTRSFLDRLPDKLLFGDFGIVHAGIRPRIAWGDQTADDLHWIRGDFLRSKTLHEVFVVHGHTPAAEIELRRNRVNVDTGAGKGGVLSCIVIQGSTIERLSERGPEALQPSR